MQKEITKQYLPQISASALKLIIHYIFYIINSLSASIALLIHTCTVIYVGSQYKKLSSAFANYEAKTDPAKHKELVNYVTPSIPSLIYIALSGHITIFLISFFGNNQSIAEVSALGRINQIFIVITSFISVFVGPYFAQLHIRELFKNYLITVANAVLLATFIFFIFYFVPQPLLWILGEKYADMESELTLSVLASCLNIVYNTMWAIHNSRKWIFWYGTFLFIGISVVSQVVGIIFLDLSTSYGVLLFNIYLTVAIGFVHLWTAVYGFYRNSTQENSKIMTTV